MCRLVLEKILIEENKVSFINTSKSNLITLVSIERFDKNDYALNVLECVEKDLNKCGKDLDYVKSILLKGKTSEKLDLMKALSVVCNAETDGWSVRGTRIDIELELDGANFIFKDYDLEFYLNLLCCKNK